MRIGRDCRCETCAAWEPHATEYTDGERRGDCRLHPPAVLAHQPSGEIITRFPVTLATAACWDWKQGP